jgi:predicted metal-binding membrane protein
MSMAWMRMPGQTWPGAAASFVGMWVVMMVAMMLPSPMLRRYRQAVDTPDGTRLGRLTTLPADARMAWRHSLSLGFHCSQCCAGLIVILLVVGVMDLRAMAFVAAAITVERLAPAGERAARAIGSVIVAAGLLLIARAAELG